MVKIKRGIRKHSLETAFDDWIEDCRERGLTQSTIQTYSEQGILFNQYLGEFNVEDLTEDLVHDFKYWLKDNRNFNDISTNTVYRTINIYLSFIHTEYGVELFHLDYVKAVRKSRRYFQMMILRN